MAAPARHLVHAEQRPRSISDRADRTEIARPVQPQRKVLNAAQPQVPEPDGRGTPNGGKALRSRDALRVIDQQPGPYATRIVELNSRARRVPSNGIDRVDSVELIPTPHRGSDLARRRAYGPLRAAVELPSHPRSMCEANRDGTGAPPITAPPWRDLQQRIRTAQIERLGFDVRRPPQDGREASRLVPVPARRAVKRRKTEHVPHAAALPFKKHGVRAVPVDLTAIAADTDEAGCGQSLDACRCRGAHRGPPLGNKLRCEGLALHGMRLGECDPWQQPPARLPRVLRGDPGGAAQLIRQPRTQRRCGGASRPRAERREPHERPECSAPHAPTAPCQRCRPTPDSHHDATATRAFAQAPPVRRSTATVPVAPRVHDFNPRRCI